MKNNQLSTGDLKQRDVYVIFCIMEVYYILTWEADVLAVNELEK